jgi:dihydroxyacetone kinase-like protein
MAIGVGVHGESSGETLVVPTADTAVDMMLPVLLDDLPFRSGDEVCVLVNNAGSMTLMELAILYRRIAQVLSERGVAVHRVWLGPYATTQESAGFAISLCRLDPEMRVLYDAPARGAAVQFMGSDTGVGS